MVLYYIPECKSPSIGIVDLTAKSAGLTQGNQTDNCGRLVPISDAFVSVWALIFVWAVPGLNNSISSRLRSCFRPESIDNLENSRNIPHNFVVDLATEALLNLIWVPPDTLVFQLGQ